MKRAILLLLTLALLLSGCVRRPEQPSLQELLTPDHLPDAPQADGQPAQADVDPLPPSGVWVDESAYTPRERLDAKYTRPEGDLSRFVPGQGPVYPYCAGENQFGFCTAGGTLVTDPIYEQIGRLYDYYDYDSHSNSPAYWVMPHPADPDDWPERGAVAADGSFAIDCRYEDIYFFGGDIKCARGETHSEFDLYDMRGRLLLSANGTEYQFPADVPAERRGEWFLIDHYGPNEPEHIFVNPGSSRRLGPYFYANQFSEGLACVSEDGEHFGYIDETGAWVLEPVYSTLSDFQDGRATQSTGDADVLIDKAGNILLETPWEGYLSRWGDLYAAELYPFLTVYDRDGSELASFEEDWNFMTPDVLCRWSAEGYALRRLDDPDRVVQISKEEMGSYPTEGAIYVDGRFLKGFVSDDHEHRVRYWASEDLKHTGYAPLPAYTEGYWWGDTVGLFVRPYADGTLTDLLTGEVYYPVCEKSRVRIFNGDGEQIWTCQPNVYIAIIGGRLGVVTDRDCTYYEQDGTVSFRFPFFVLPDD